jgi:hypothetical protein
MAEGGGTVSCKMGHQRNVMGEIRVGIKRIGLHKFQNNCNGLSPTLNSILT